jgi:hypothetical protein
MNFVAPTKVFSFRHFCFQLLLLFLLVPAYAQVRYPVYVNTQLAAPYSPDVTSWYAGMLPKLKVTLISQDMQQPLVEVYLRMKITSSGFSIVTPDYVYTSSIQLQSGMPVTLMLNDLETYFKDENMNISGGRNEFLRSRMLPDGYYHVNFEVHERNTNRLVSNPNMGYSMAFITTGEPPILNLPKTESIIKESAIPNILFSWTPKINSMTAAFGSEYEFSLVEIYDKEIKPEGAFDYSRVQYTETTKSPFFTHSIAQPMLLPGMRYAWRVRVKARDNISQEEVNVYRNNGNSPVFWFDYVVDCKIVQSMGDIYEDGHINIMWEDVGAMEYSVEYRKKGSTAWINAGIKEMNLAQIFNLKVGQEYEYRIGTRCMINDVFQYNEPKGFKMPDRPESGPNCGIMPDTKLTNKTALQELVPSPLFPVFAGDFPVFITKVEGAGTGTGTFSGEGYVGIPYLKGLQVAVTFKDIVINSDRKLVSGFFELNYDPAKADAMLSDKKEEDKKGVTDEVKVSYTVDFIINPNVGGKYTHVLENALKDEIEEGGGDNQLSKGENGYYILTLTDTEGNEHDVKVYELPTNVKDKEGKVYEVKKKEGSEDKVILQPDHASGKWDYEYIATLENTIDIDAKDGKETIKGNDRYYFATDMDNRPIIKLQIDSSAYYGKKPMDYPCRWYVNNELISSDTPSNKLELSGKPGAYEIKAKKIDSDATIFSMTAVVIDDFEITIHPNDRYDGEYGFDDNRFDEIASINGTEYLENKYRIPFMSLLQDQHATVEARLVYSSQKLNPADLENIALTFRSSGNNLSVISKAGNIATTTGALTCKLSDFKDGKMELVIYGKNKTEKEYIDVRVGQKLIGRINVRVRPPLPSTRLRLIKIVINGTIGKNIDIEAKKKDLERYLNKKSYNQSFTQWKVNEPEILNLTVNSDNITLKEILDLANKHYEGSSDILIFFSDTKNPDAYNGWGANNSAIIHIDAGYKTPIHELGHIHGLSDIGGGSKNIFYDTNNFMDYSSIRNMFWKHEWDFIYNKIYEMQRKNNLTK